MKLICQRCWKLKNGVHSVLILGQEKMICNRCSTKVSNLLTIYNYKTTKEDYKLKLEKLMFSAIGFEKA